MFLKRLVGQGQGKALSDITSPNCSRVCREPLLLINELPHADKMQKNIIFVMTNSCR